MSRFQLGEDAVKRSVRDRGGLPLVVAGISVGFLAASALFVVLYYLLTHH